MRVRKHIPVPGKSGEEGLKRSLRRQGCSGLDLGVTKNVRLWQESRSPWQCAAELARLLQAERIVVAPGASRDSVCVSPSVPLWRVLGVLECPGFNQKA